MTRVLPGMQSAFVDIGLERDAFLYVADVGRGARREPALARGAGAARPSATPRSRSSCSEGQDVLVQVLKEPLGTKGARITSHVSLPGRYLVFMPTVEHVGVSRKITDDEERRRLKTLLKEIRQERGGGGFIARTAGLGRSREDFERDARYLIKDLGRGAGARRARARAGAAAPRAVARPAPAARHPLGRDIASISLDSEREFQRDPGARDAAAARARAARAPAQRRGRTSSRSTASPPSWSARCAPKVWLASGGYIVINPTEALVAIDVNTGRFVGKKNLEDTILKTNLEAVREIVRQIRLRDLGGIIVVDFIDMEERKSRQQGAWRVLEQELRGTARRRRCCRSTSSAS